MAAEKGITVEQYKAELEARKGNTAVAVRPKPETEEGEEKAATDGEDQDDVSRVKFCESRKIFGIIPHPNKRYVTLVRRNYYEEETIGTKGRGAGKVYAAGTYGPWKMAEATFPSSKEQALLMVANLLENEYLDKDEADDIRNLVSIMQRVRDEIIEHFKA